MFNNKKRNSSALNRKLNKRTRRPLSRKHTKKGILNRRSKVFSKYSNVQRDTDNSSTLLAQRKERLNEVKAAQRKKYLIRTVSICIGISLLVWSVFYSWISGVNYVGHINDSQRQRSSEVIENYFEQTSRFRTGFSPTTLENYLKTAMPEYKDINVNLPLFSREVQVEFIESEPQVYWQVAGRKYAISHQGIVLGASTNLDADLPLIYDSSNVALSPGIRIVEPRFIQFVIDTEKVTDSLQFGVASYRVESSSRILRVDLEGESYEVITSTETMPSAQWGTVKDLIAELSNDDQASPAEYIDTRIPGRVFWQ